MNGRRQNNQAEGSGVGIVPQATEDPVGGFYCRCGLKQIEIQIANIHGLNADLNASKLRLEDVFKPLCTIRRVVHQIHV
jgi:hypothetical protein